MRRKRAAEETRRPRNSRRKWREREGARAEIKAGVKAKETSEDEAIRKEEEMQKIVDEGMEKLEEIAKIKMKELEN